MKKVLQMILAFNLGVLFTCIAGCTATLDVYSPFVKGGNLQERQLVHDKMPLSFDDRRAMSAAYNAKYRGK